MSYGISLRNQATQLLIKDSVLSNPEKCFELTFCFLLLLCVTSILDGERIPPSHFGTDTETKDHRRIN